MTGQNGSHGLKLGLKLEPLPHPSVEALPNQSFTAHSGPEHRGAIEAILHGPQQDRIPTGSQQR